MNFDKESKSRKKNFFWRPGEGGGANGGNYGRLVHESCHILYTQHIVTTSSTEPYNFLKIILTVFKIESTASEGV